MMKEKLTLTIEKNVKEKAKNFAQRRGISVSAIVEKYLQSLYETEDDWKPKKGSIVAEITASVANKKNREYDDILEEALTENYRHENLD